MQTPGKAVLMQKLDLTATATPLRDLQIQFKLNVALECTDLGVYLSKESNAAPLTS
jgi:hypothetical protein